MSIINNVLFAWLGYQKHLKCRKKFFKQNVAQFGKLVLKNASKIVPSGGVESKA